MKKNGKKILFQIFIIKLSKNVQSNHRTFLTKRRVIFSYFCVIFSWSFGLKWRLNFSKNINEKNFRYSFVRMRLRAFYLFSMLFSQLNQICSSSKNLLSSSSSKSKLKKSNTDAHSSLFDRKIRHWEFIDILNDLEAVAALPFGMKISRILNP